jgi:hypothetical protein
LSPDTGRKYLSAVQRMVIRDVLAYLATVRPMPEPMHAALGSRAHQRDR